MSSLQQIFSLDNAFVRRILNWKQGDEEDVWRNKAVEVLIKKLKQKANDNQYSNLQLVLNKKTEDTPCITISRSQDGRIQVSHRKMLPHVMSCRIFRWPDLQSQHELKSVPICKYPAGREPTKSPASQRDGNKNQAGQQESSKICINPYHYARVDHSLCPPVVTPRNSEFTNCSPPPQSPISPGSGYSQQHGSPTNYFQQSANNSQQAPILSLGPVPQPAHEHNHQYQHHMQKLEPNINDSFQYMNTGSQILPNQHQANQMPYAYGCQSPMSESNYYPAIGETLAESPRAPQSFESQTPPPRYSGRDPQHQFAVMPMDTVDDFAPSAINGADECQEPWCKIQYLELSLKIGDPFKGSSKKIYVDGFTNPSIHNRRFSLGVLSNVNRNSVIECTRRAIRKGVCLENIDSQIYVKNLSESSIFFHSKNCNVENQLNQHTVVKIGPNTRQKIFDQNVFENLVQEAIRGQDGKTFDRLFSLTDHCTIKMSFVKGWGSIYARQDVTATPCWIEIILLKPCALIDQYLRQTGPPSNPITSTS